MRRQRCSTRRGAGVPRLVHVGSTAALGSPTAAGCAGRDETLGFNLQRFELPCQRVGSGAQTSSSSQAGSPGLETVVVSPGFTFGSWRDGYRGGEVIERVLRRRVVPCTNGGSSASSTSTTSSPASAVAAARGRAGERHPVGAEPDLPRDRTDGRTRPGEKKLVVTVPDVARDLAGVVLNSERARRRGSRPLLFLEPSPRTSTTARQGTVRAGTASGRSRRSSPGRAPAPAAALSRQRAPATNCSNSRSTNAIISSGEAGVDADPEGPVHYHVAVRQLADGAEVDVLALADALVLPPRGGASRSSGSRGGA